LSKPRDARAEAQIPLLETINPNDLHRKISGNITDSNQGARRPILAGATLKGNRFVDNFVAKWSTAATFGGHI